MQTYEYIVVPAPRKGVSAKGVKGVPGKFANAITTLMNEMAAEGWEYQRSDTLPCEERQGLTGKTVKYHAMLVFRRAIEADEPAEDPLALPSPDEDDAIAEEDSVAEPEAEAEDVGSDDDPFAEPQDEDTADSEEKT